jgi:hypothetical protein
LLYRLWLLMAKCQPLLVWTHRLSASLIAPRPVDLVVICFSGCLPVSDCLSCRTQGPCQVSNILLLGQSLHKGAGGNFLPRNLVIEDSSCTVAAFPPFVRFITPLVALWCSCSYHSRCDSSVVLEHPAPPCLCTGASSSIMVPSSVLEHLAPSSPAAQE